MAGKSGHETCVMERALPAFAGHRMGFRQQALHDSYQRYRQRRSNRAEHRTKDPNRNPLDEGPAQS